MLASILLNTLKTRDEILALLRPGPPILRGVRGVGEEVPKVFCPVVWLASLNKQSRAVEPLRFNCPEVILFTLN